MKKRIVGLLIAVVMIATVPMTSFASEQSDDIALIQINDNKVVLHNYEGTAVISSTENEKNIEIDIRDTSGEDGTLIIDKINRTVYSTYTNETVELDGLIYNEEDLLRSSDEGIESVTVVWTKTYKFSYAKMAKVVSAGASDLSIASAIIALAAAAAGVSISTAAAVVLAMITIGLETIRAGLKKKDKKHGVKVKVVKEKIKRHGQIGYRYRIASVKTY